MFDALAKLSPEIPSAYERASEFGDLHLGDLHLIQVTGQHLNILVIQLIFLVVVESSRKCWNIVQVVTWTITITIIKDVSGWA